MSENVQAIIKVKNPDTGEFEEISIKGSTDDLTDSSGKNLTSILDDIRGMIIEHTTNEDNPHTVTKKDIGLDKVQNLPLTTMDDAKKGTSNDSYMTPLRTTQLAMDLFSKESEPIEKEIGIHKLDKSNPHNVTKAQVGLANTPNYGMASEYGAKQGVENNSLMSPLRTHNAIDSVLEKTICSGEGQFSASGTTITLPSNFVDGTLNYSVSITIIGSDHKGDAGAISISRSSGSFKVINSGNNSTSKFTWIAVRH